MKKYKQNDAMITPRKKMVKWFLLITFAAWVLSTILQLVNDQPLMTTRREERSIELEFDFVMVLIAIVIYAVSGFLFNVFVKRFGETKKA